MNASVPTHERLDPRALETRTRAIGHELFALARREHTHLSVLNRWTAQVLSWCLADPALKGNVLRFIDVLPSLQSPRAVARHVREYFPTSNLRLPPALRVGATLARPGLLTAPVVSGVISQLVEQVARQFIAESSPEGATHMVKQMSARGLTCSFDILGEQVLSEPEADRYAAQCQTVLQDVSRAYAGLEPSATILTCGPRANLSVKPSALTPRFDPISPSQSIERAARRLLPIFGLANEIGALINLDMEQYELRDVTLGLAQHLLVHPQIGRQAELGIVIQAYLQDADAVVEEWLAWLGTHERPLTIRLVKGAYWDSEVAQAAQHHWPVPVYERKGQTDLAFERLTRRLLGAHPLVRTAVASHNVRSIAHAMAVAELLGLPKDHVEFQLLYGMGEALTGAIAARGFPVRVYTPIGALIPGMAYLVRRLLENTANESFLRQDFLEERSADELLRPPEDSAGPAGSPAEIVHHTVWRGGEPTLDWSKADHRNRFAHALEAVRARMGDRYAVLLADGQAQTDEELTVRNPANPDEIVGQVAQASPVEAGRAVRLAREAQSRWAQVPVRERSACLRRAAQLLRARRYELAAWEVIEVGKPWREADADIVETIDYLEYYSESMEHLAEGKLLAQVPGERNTYVYVPRGIAVVIAPWNFPSAILTGMASAAIVSGNAAILKPAEQSPIIAAHVTAILREAGVPSGIVQCLPGLGHDVGASLVQHHDTHAVLFTGSRVVGLSILESCRHVERGERHIKHVIAEMGSKNPIIVDADADLDAAVAGSLSSAFGYAGQKCSAASRLIVHAAVYERFLERLVAAVDRLVLGDPADADTDVGPLIDQTARGRLVDAIHMAHDVGHVAYAYPASRIPSHGYFVGPTIVTDVPRHHALVRDELFGPLVCIFRVDTFEEALALANDTDYALTGGVYSRSPSHIGRAIDAFDVGNLYINRQITGAVVGRQPFGGHRLSGLGTKAGGPDYLLQLLTPKTITTNTARHGMPLE